MSMPNIYEYFNAQGSCVGSGQSEIWSPPPLSDEAQKNEALCALFMVASAVEEGQFPLDVAQTITDVVVNDKKFSLLDLVAHVRSGSYQIGDFADYQLMLSYEDPPRDAMGVIVSVFPDFSG